MAWTADAGRNVIPYYYRYAPQNNMGVSTGNQSPNTPPRNQTLTSVSLHSSAVSPFRTPISTGRWPVPSPNGQSSEQGTTGNWYLSPIGTRVLSGQAMQVSSSAFTLPQTSPTSFQPSECPFGTPQNPRRLPFRFFQHVDDVARPFFYRTPVPSKEAVTRFSFNEGAQYTGDMLTNDTMQKVFDENPLIREVEFGSNTLSGRSAMAGELTFECLKKLKYLTSVVFSDEYYSLHSNGTAFQNLCRVLAKLPNLKMLRLVDVKADQAFDFDEEITKHLSQIKQLTYLDLSGSGFNNQLGEYLSELSQLEYLDLSDTKVNAIASYLKDLPKLTTVRLALSADTSKPNFFEAMSEILHQYRSDIIVLK